MRVIIAFEGGNSNNCNITTKAKKKKKICEWMNEKKKLLIIKPPNAKIKKRKKFEWEERWINKQNESRTDFDWNRFYVLCIFLFNSVFVCVFSLLFISFRVLLLFCSFQFRIHYWLMLLPKSILILLYFLRISAARISLMCFFFALVVVKFIVTWTLSKEKY